MIDKHISWDNLEDLEERLSHVDRHILLIRHELTKAKEAPLGGPKVGPLTSMLMVEEKHRQDIVLAIGALTTPH